MQPVDANRKPVSETAQAPFVSLDAKRRSKRIFRATRNTIPLFFPLFSNNDNEFFIGKPVSERLLTEKQFHLQFRRPLKVQ